MQIRADSAEFQMGVGGGAKGAWPTVPENSGTGSCVLSWMGHDSSGNPQGRRERCECHRDVVTDVGPTGMSQQVCHPWRPSQITWTPRITVPMVSSGPMTPGEGQTKPRCFLPKINNSSPRGEFQGMGNSGPNDWKSWRKSAGAKRGDGKQGIKGLLS